jgi:predicted nucleic acid-binding protein
LAAGKKQRTLQEAFMLAMNQDLAGRVLPFDTAAADKTATIAAKLRFAGQPIELRDAMIAGTVAAHSGTLATRNTKHFMDAGIPLINPWQPGPP